MTSFSQAHQIAVNEALTDMFPPCNSKLGGSNFPAGFKINDVRMRCDMLTSALHKIKEACWIKVAPPPLSYTAQTII